MSEESTKSRHFDRNIHPALWPARVSKFVYDDPKIRWVLTSDIEYYVATI